MVECPECGEDLAIQTDSDDYSVVAYVRCEDCGVVVIISVVVLEVLGE